jgi:adenine phosphoribosyltransferase
MHKKRGMNKRQARGTTRAKMNYKALIREVPNFPRPGILFYDITTLLKDARAFRAVLDELAARYRGRRISKIVGIESRGFILGGPLADRIKAGFVPVRKPGKLPADSFEVKYNLEYGSNSLAIHRDAVQMGERVLVVDDLLATGGTAEAAGRLVRGRGAEIVGFSFLIELGFLEGRNALAPQRVEALIRY